MKHFFTIALILVTVAAANATVHIITCQNTPSHFLPLTLNAETGDTIHWTWVEGTHIVGPVNINDIPGGAATWNGYIDAGHLSYEYVVTVPGTYNYDCHPATPHGENASFVVTGTPTGVQQYNLSNLFSAYPNPSTGIIQFSVDDLQLNGNSRLEINNVQGQLVYKSLITTAKTLIDLGNEASGIYTARFYNGQTILTRKLVIE